jgi:hypothetical protein
MLCNVLYLMVIICSVFSWGGSLLLVIVPSFSLRNIRPVNCCAVKAHHILVFTLCNGICWKTWRLSSLYLFILHIVMISKIMKVKKKTLATRMICLQIHTCFPLKVNISLSIPIKCITFPLESDVFHRFLMHFWSSWFHEYCVSHFQYPQLILHIFSNLLL